ncbi:hypothetical protein GIB67_001628 [Kingdonia uniflora]|uniref:Fe2OG dioxygenase domain-containing protein n=1 Tax=Kingdonia uniflora TaxID=39325 RepID=A0A7J7L0V6_9MAGN|nr:hypothetical protein GIB67_001628 [Kingdonia uniflora]
MALAMSDLGDIMDFVVSKGNGVKGLSETGLETVPKQYVQPMEERLDMNNVVNQDSIPVIDMSKYLEDPKVAESICLAAEKWSFFQVINHGVPIESLDKVEEATRQFFRLPAEAKLKYTEENSPTCNVRYGTSFIPQAETCLEWKDYLSLLYVSKEEASSFWPRECRKQAVEFMKLTEPVIKQLIEALMKGLKVKEIDERKESLLMGSKRINLNYYPMCPNPELTASLGRHSDVSTLTVLLQDDIGGLCVRLPDEENSWAHVPPIRGSLVINIGDALQIISNGHYKSVEHLVIANEKRSRVSVPIFVYPGASNVIGSFAEVLKNGEKAVYKQVWYKEYLKHFLEKAHDGKKTIE